ncbi:Clr5 domain-containing protein [Truncatella angustata]|uniref:Clr5 domain-containing protein n=1 Tax=Truncatella angustata TaxID=152316 RepID=A0A9P9A0K4_9PEZI|nr:Clr5 domain-containing protein [Truncatella angustata]KAH6657363.1 Clr5 domain-containing protein [Truncatella angustata]KAH8194506.1 hypothetical protein TruAng_011329 [Truncatella angustata]
MSQPARAADAPPQRGDWERHKRRIAQLYLEENKPLREVADAMRTEHNFTATPKMYKQRFHQWDFRKNLKAGEVKKYKVQTAAGHETHLPVVHGRKLGSKRLKSLVVKSNKSLSRSPGSESSYGTPTPTTPGPATPLPGTISAPDDVRLAENSIRAVVAYSRTQLNDQLWNLANYDEKLTGTYFWSQGINLAAYKIAEKRDLAANFQVLNKSCDEFRSVLKKQDPLLVWATYNAILQLSNVGEDIAKSFAKLAAGLSQIHFGRSHPMTVLWSSVRRMSVQDVQKLALPITDAQFGLFHDDSRPGNSFWPKHTINVAKKLHDLGLITPEQTHQKLNYALQWIQQNPGPDIQVAEERLNSTRMFIACIYIDHKEYSKSDAVLSEVERWKDNGGLISDNQLVNCTEIRAELEWKMGNNDRSEFLYKKALATAQELLWEKDPGRIGFSFSALENFYIETGNEDAAETVRAAYNAHLQLFVGDAEEGNMLMEDTRVQELSDYESDG